MARIAKVACIVAFVVVMSSPMCLARRKTYYGDRLIRIAPGYSNSTFELLNDLLIEDLKYQLDFWTFPTPLSRPIDIHVPRATWRSFEQLLKKNNVAYEVRSRNLQRLIDKERPHTRLRGGSSFDSSFQSYPRIVAEMRRLARMNNSIAHVNSIGKTYEGRHMYMIRISANRTRNKHKPIIFLNCGIHSREWISISTCMYIARKLVNDYSTDSNVRRLVEKLEWMIIPVINVDGYQYTRDRDRMWRKNKNPNINGCIGTDLNRNFNYNWGGIGSKPNRPCSPIYPGPRPFSEPESTNVAQYLYKRRKRLKAYVDFHSYGQLWMSPWGYKAQFPPNYKKQAVAMNKVVKAIKQVHGTVFSYGPSSIMIYPTSGDATDWTYGVLGVTHSYGVELRPGLMNGYGFTLPPSFIEPVGRETYNGIKALSALLCEAQ